MSRIGKLPVSLPDKVSVEVLPGNVVKVKGPLGELSQKVDPDIKVTVEDNEIKFTRPTDQPRHRSMHGLYRALIHNMVVGVTKGFEKSLIVNGVGYKVTLSGNKMTLNIGFSHPVEFTAPEGITFAQPQPLEIVVKGIDRQLVGQTAATIKAIKPVEPYHNYGIHYKDEPVIHKVGKRATK